VHTGLRKFNLLCYTCSEANHGTRAQKQLTRARRASAPILTSITSNIVYLVYAHSLNSYIILPWKILFYYPSVIHVGSWNWKSGCWTYLRK
jgi:hypothetical protein